ncbi:sensor histidine kinase [Methylocapsa palsarum]|uniref:histidine kinase n=1 Tax=Methylocapsa palsarum TaxID=1612308 RepID=A0A1I4AYF1_9HYPH|nr:sensor histidine kinase KdpD [Methylocapsa palsarum]SFK60719.1 two-component system, OmpR family, sensor histidine kinase KdpD [Methylocapsa palsarum]
MAQTEKNFDRRPDPDALLALTDSGSRGKLRVFLGAAPGVGKTYAMLAKARACKLDGIDVVVGLVETHGRRETEALIEGLEILPRRKIEYRGRIIEEFDIDAALARRPKLIIVDELAHTNAPDNRHPKRWQDVEELLEAGVDVWTALNIQHLESLADVVSRITGVIVRETVPDTVLQDATDVILVDITPDELLHRLKEGKVYVPETARRATQNFFTPGNLTALRELALRRTADRVDDQMIDYLRQNAIEGPWATSERLLVCVGGVVSAELVVRAAARLATGLNAPWIALHVETRGQEESDPERAKRIEDALALAERLGGDVERRSGYDLPGEVLRFARQENITQIVVGRSRATFLARLMRWSLTEELVRRSNDIAVYVVTEAHGPPIAERRALPRPSRIEAGIALLAALLSVGVTVGAAQLIDAWLRLPNLSMMFLVPVIFCAVQYGLSSAAAASVLSFLAFDFFFVDPRYEFTISQPHEFFSLIVFLAVAFVTGMLASRVRQQSLAMATRMQAAQSMFEFSRKLSGAGKLDDVLWAAAVHAQKTLQAQCIVLLRPDDGELNIQTAWPPVDQLNPGEASAARWALEKDEPAGWKTGTLPNVRFQFRPLETPRGVIGVCGIEPRLAKEPLSSQDENMLTSILEQTAIAIDRSLLVDESVKASALEENEKVRNMLLASLSHDLRTPLASITGAVTSLLQLGDRMQPTDRQDLLVSIEEEAGRLSRFVANLLDMSRIESGALAPRRELVDIGEAVRSAIERSAKVFPKQTVSVSIARDLPLIRGDSALLGQVLFNLLDNAHKYAGDSNAIIHARRDGPDVVITVTDEGPGIKPADLERIFEKFYRGGRPDGRKAGTGLGLSICRGLVEAMGGSIVAQSPAIRRRGTRIVLRFPVPEIGKGGVAA